MLRLIVIINLSRFIIVAISQPILPCIQALIIMKVVVINQILHYSYCTMLNQSLKPFHCLMASQFVDHKVALTISAII